MLNLCFTKILVINCLQIEEHISHLNLNEALKIVKKLDVKEVYFTHISHYLGLHDILNKDLPLNVNLAHDSLLLEL